MKNKAFHEMTDSELVEKLASLKQELYSLRFSHATNQLDNNQQLKLVKRDIARVMTEQRARQLGKTPVVKKA